MAYDIKQCRYILQGVCIEEEAMQYSRLHAVGEVMTMRSIHYKVVAVIVDGTTQIIDLGIAPTEYGRPVYK